MSLTSFIDDLRNLLAATRATDDAGGALGLDRASAMAVEMIGQARDGGGKIMVIGNGGSAAIAGHMQNDLQNSAGLKALVFQEPANLTALSNDHGYGSVFERPVARWAAPGDVLVAISSSGRSENILGAVRAARAAGCRVITLSGFAPDNPLGQLGQVNFHVASTSYGAVESAHAVLCHYLSDAVAGKA